jgi:hypothetical protein
MRSFGVILDVRRNVRVVRILREYRREEWAFAVGLCKQITKHIRIVIAKHIGLSLEAGPRNLIAAEGFLKAQMGQHSG